MFTAKIFEDDKGQAVMLPKEYKFNCDEVLINKIGDTILLIPKNKKWHEVMLGGFFSKDFFNEGRKQPKSEKREELK